MGSAIVDLGAQFVHGEKGNIAYSLAKDVVVHNSHKLTIYYDGKRKTGDDLQKESQQIYLDIGKQTHSKDLSLGEAYLERYSFNNCLFSKSIILNSMA